MKLNDILESGQVSQEGIARLERIEEEINSLEETIKKQAKAFCREVWSYEWTRGNNYVYYTKEEFRDNIFNKEIEAKKRHIESLESNLRHLEETINNHNNKSWWRRLKKL